VEQFRNDPLKRAYNGFFEGKKGVFPRGLWQEQGDIAFQVISGISFIVRIPHNRARLSPKPTEILSQMPTIWSQEHLEEFGPAVDLGVNDGHAPFIIFHMDMAMFHQKSPDPSP